MNNRQRMMRTLTLTGGEIAALWKSLYPEYVVASEFVNGNVRVLFKGDIAPCKGAWAKYESYTQDAVYLWIRACAANRGLPPRI